MLLYSSLSTFLYVQQAGIVDVTFANRAARTAFFARIDLMVNVLTLGAQLFLTAQVLKRFGVALTLTLVPAATVIGFLTLGVVPSLAIVVAFIVIRRAGNCVHGRAAGAVHRVVARRNTRPKAPSTRWSIAWATRSVYTSSFHDGGIGTGGAWRGGGAAVCGVGWNCMVV
jgi:AAA family ATP:ADP antiporter